MRKLITILISILTTLSVFAQQIPQSFSFQGIAKDEFGQAMQEGGLVSLRFTIYEGSGTAGTLLFQEIHNSIEIKQGGVISVNVGNGSATNGNFTEIIWNSQKTLAVGIDESNGSFFSALGNLLILSAPYSFYSEKTKPFPLQELSDVNAFGITAGQVLQWNGSEWQPVDYVSSQNYTAGTGISIIGNEITNTGDTDASDDFSGDYNDLINKPVIPLDFSELTDNSNLLFDGNYNSLSNLPILFNGDYADLTNKPNFAGWDTNQADDFSGNYSDLLNKPIIPLDFSDLTDNSNLLFDKDYNSLNNLPTLFSGNYSDLTNQPVLFSKNFTDLTNTPTTILGYGITDAFSGSYDDLTNQPDFSTFATKNMNNQNITNLAEPINANDAVTKAYVDLLEARIFALEPVEIGDFREGGVVFHIFATGEPGYIEGEQHGLVCAVINQSSNAIWGCNGGAISGADGTLIGTGAQNTIDIEAGCTYAGIAADLCSNLTLNGYSDWFLPSKNELNAMYQNRTEINTTAVVNEGTALSSDWYWSSSQNFVNAWAKDFAGTGMQSSVTKNSSNQVRAIRAF